MEIGTAADAQAVFLSEGMHMAFFCLMVSAVNGFNAGQSVFGQSVYKRVQGCITHMIKGRMGKNRQTVRFQDQLYCLGGGHFFPGDKIFGAVADISLESLRNAFDITVIQKIFCIVPPCNDRSGEGSL